MKQKLLLCGVALSFVCLAACGKNTASTSQQEVARGSNVSGSSVSAGSITVTPDPVKVEIKMDYSKIPDKKVKMTDTSKVTSKMVYGEREKNQGEKYYVEKSSETDKLYMYEETEDIARFSVHLSEYDLNVVAKKNSDGKYECYIKEYPEYEERYSVAEEGEYRLLLWHEEDELQLEVTTLDGKIETDSMDTITEKVTCIEKELPKKTQTFDLKKCIGDYYKVRKSIYSKTNDSKLDFGKEPGSTRLSYIEVNNSGRVTETQMGDVNFFSTKEECDKAFGTPIRTTEENRVYKFDDDYEIQITFAGESICKMGIYLGNKETATQEYRVGKFTMRGCQIIKYNEGYKKAGKVNLPKDVVAFEIDSFSATKRNTGGGYKVQKIKLQIPSQVYIEPFAFRQMGHAEITFEEGRREIEKGAFRDIGYKNYKVKILLPSSVKKLNEFAFANSVNSDGITIVFSDGLEIIESNAMEGMKIDLPSSVRILEASALGGWMPKGEFGLPEGVEEIGDNCFDFEEAEEPFKIPSTVKKIGIDAFSFGEGVKVPKVKVDPRNPYFKSDENGWLFSKDGKTLYYAWADSDYVELPKGLEYIACDFESYPEVGEIVIDYPNSFKKDLYKEYWENR